MKLTEIRRVEIKSRSSAKELKIDRVLGSSLKRLWWDHTCPDHLISVQKRSETRTRPRQSRSVKVNASQCIPVLSGKILKTNPCLYRCSSQKTRHHCQPSRDCLKQFTEVYETWAARHLCLKATAAEEHASKRCDAGLMERGIRNHLQEICVLKKNKTAAWQSMSMTAFLQLKRWCTKSNHKWSLETHSKSQRWITAHLSCRLEVESPGKQAWAHVRVRCQDWEIRGV